MPPIPLKVLLQERVNKLSPKKNKAGKTTRAAKTSSKDTKVGHVKRAAQNRDHHCHWPGCGKQVPPAMWGCKHHWLLLPKRIRERLWLAYRIGQEEDMKPSVEYISVARAVQDWIKTHYPNG